MSDETILQSKVPPPQAGKPLLDYLSGRFRYQTSDQWKDLILQGKVTVNSQKAQPQLILKKGDKVAYAVVLKEPPVDKNIRVLHEEEDFLVADKPGQLPSHADGNYIKNTFIYLINQTLKEKGFTGTAHLVHRLDRETSGLMVVAKTPAAHLKLLQQFEKSTVKKEYLAVVRGKVSQEHFELSGALGKDTESAISIRQKVVPADTPFAKSASTYFEKMKDLKEGALLKCVPKTGRTNQIRVHLASLGHPLVGDKLYGRTDKEFLEFVHHVKAGGDPSYEGRFETPRHLLHAAKLTFDHPETGQRVTFEAPTPQDMEDYIQKNS